MINLLETIRVAAVLGTALNNLGRGKDTDAFIEQARAIEHYIRLDVE